MKKHEYGDSYTGMKCGALVVDAEGFGDMCGLSETDKIHRMEETEYYEYGYRLADGTESWEIDHGTDGSWTEFDPSRGIKAIYFYNGSEVSSIYSELDSAGVSGVAIRRKVTRIEGEPEEVSRVV